jgi:hypothetical protein
MTDESQTDPASVRPRRGAREWIVLLMAWSIGLIVWTVYIAMYVYLVIRVLT